MQGMFWMTVTTNCISWYIPWGGLMMREWPYTASSRDVLGCTSPPTSRFPSALEMSLGLRPRDISRASGNLSVVGDVQPNTSLLSAVYRYNVSWRGKGQVFCHEIYILSLDARAATCVGFCWQHPLLLGGLGVMGGMDVTPYGCLQRTNGGAVSG